MSFQDLKSLELVEAQLQSFRAEMERDSSIQREKVQKLVRTAVVKAEEIVDRELQLSSSNLSTYLFKAKGGQVGRSGRCHSESGRVAPQTVPLEIWASRLHWDLGVSPRYG